MKRAMILLVLLPALLLSGSVYAAARVNSTRDAACFSPVVLTGDPELCEGVTIRAYTSFSDSRGLNRLITSSAWTPPPARTAASFPSTSPSGTPRRSCRTGPTGSCRR